MEFKKELIITLALDDQELSVLEYEAKVDDLSIAQVMRQALRVYQIVRSKQRSGEEVDLDIVPRQPKYLPFPSTES